MGDVFDRDFCIFLEYRLCKLLKYNEDTDTKGDIDTKGFWCDGVILETVLDHHACFTAYFGKSGQVEYNLFLEFGEMSSKLYAEGSRLEVSVPDIEQAHFLSVDVPHRRIYLNLN